MAVFQSLDDGDILGAFLLAFAALDTGGSGHLALLVVGPKYPVELFRMCGQAPHPMAQSASDPWMGEWW